MFYEKALGKKKQQNISEKSQIEIKREIPHSHLVKNEKPLVSQGQTRGDPEPPTRFERVTYGLQNHPLKTAMTLMTRR